MRRYYTQEIFCNFTEIIICLIDLLWIYFSELSPTEKKRFFSQHCLIHHFYYKLKIFNPNALIMYSHCKPNTNFCILTDHRIIFNQCVLPLSGTFCTSVLILWVIILDSSSLNGLLSTRLPNFRGGTIWVKYNT